jgi:hypothetical protein
MRVPVQSLKLPLTFIVSVCSTNLSIGCLAWGLCRILYNIYIYNLTHRNCKGNKEINQTYFPKHKIRPSL